jgi:hypothetical protein
MEKYWKARPTASPTAPAASTSDVAQPNEASILSEFDRHRLALLSSQDDDEGWQPEMRRYCSRNDQLNKINTFLLVIFVEMSDKKKMLLPE